MNQTNNIPSSKQRLLALDILRGITIAGMILVNDPGSWSYVYAPLQHAEWNGLTPTDLVFPFFMFMMGISTYISLRKYDFRFSADAGRKILKRTVVIFAIGLGINWLQCSFGTWHALAASDLSTGERLFDSIWCWENIRILGVMQRLALCYGAASIIAITVKHRYIPYLIAALLVGYFVLLMLGHGFAYNDTNILSVVDRHILGLHHMYNDHGIDPEGILSTIPSIAHVLLGFCIGRWMMLAATVSEKLERLFIIGAILTFSGFLLAYGCPLNKKIWSPTYVLVTCGLGSTFLALLIWIIDVKGYKKWSRFFESFGVNPLFIYVFAAVLAILFGGITFTIDGTTMNTQGFLYNVCLDSWMGNYFASLVYAVLFVCLNWAIGYRLYKKKIYIKI